MFRTLKLGINFIINSKNELVGYIDSDYTKLIDNQKSIAGYIFMISGRPLSYQSKLHNTITLLLYEAEYMAIIEVIKEVLWVA